FRQQHQISDSIAVGVKLMLLLEFVPVLLKFVRPDVLNLVRFCASTDKVRRKIRRQPRLLFDESGDSRQKEFYELTVHPMESELRHAAPFLFHIIELALQ